MITKHELREYRDELLELRQIGERKELLETRLYCLQSPSLSGMPHSETVESGSRQERAADAKSEELESLIAEYAERERALFAKCLRIEREINRLPARYRVIFRGYYIEGQKWRTVADRAHYSFERCMQLHREGLKKLRDDETLH